MINELIKPAYVQLQASLLPFNTFRFDYNAEYLAIVNTFDQLQECVSWANQQALDITVLGGGSNLLIQGDVQGLVIVNQLSGHEIVSEGEDIVLVEFNGGEVWHECVEWTVKNGLGGIENLALIPGSIGAAPVQNIGAYGVEVKDVLHEIKVLDISSGELLKILPKDCEFGYRESNFKGKWRGRYIITSVTLSLSKQPKLVLEYGGLKAIMPDNPSIKDVFDAVCKVRQSKLPDPNEIANSGSFFKNPVVSNSEFLRIKTAFPSVVAFEQNGNWKLAAGWLNDQAGWKGVKQKGVGVYEKQALVLVNFDCSKADALLQLEADIKTSVFEKFGVHLEREPVLLGGACGN
jgi:UDP-N-acetylmuramate dehydrogenase